jgi:hypothetical protein
MDVVDQLEQLCAQLDSRDELLATVEEAVTLLLHLGVSFSEICNLVARAAVQVEKEQAD